MSDYDRAENHGMPDPGMIASGDGMRAKESWEMDQRGGNKRKANSESEGAMTDETPLSRQELKQHLIDYFNIGVDCYTYSLTRCKTGFAVGTVTIDDFEELDEEIIDDVVSYVFGDGVHAGR